MKTFLKYLGPIILLIGTILLAVYYFTKPAENVLLVVTGVLMVVGLLTHVIINRFIE